MPRPDSLTAADLAAAEAALLHLRVGLALPADLFASEHFREANVASVWLGRQLAALGCPAERLERILQANGQAAYHHADVWTPTLRTLALYQQGKTEEPGIGLAARLIQEHGLEQGGTR